MIRPNHIDPWAPAIVINVGNTHTNLAIWNHERLGATVRSATGEMTAFEEAYRAQIDTLPKNRITPTVIGSVVPDATTQICEFIDELFSHDALVIGRQVPLPMDVAVEDSVKIGVDRVCASAAAYEQLQAACTVVDFGTAVTVNLVDDEGVLLGGAILPGVQLQLRSLAEHTAQLPPLTASAPHSLFGRNTEEAMLVGVCRGLVGAVRGIVEGYASSINRWPHVVATGGDLELLLPMCDFIDSPVKDLTLRGIGLAYTKFLREQNV